MSTTLNIGKTAAELAAVSELGADNLMIVHDGSGLKKIEVDDAMLSLINKAGIHPNSIVAVRDITGTWYNGTLRSEVAAGDFSHIQPGNYIIGRTTGVKWWVVDLDYYYGNRTSGYNVTGYAECTHHVAVMPQLLLDYSGYSTHLWSGQENSSSTTLVTEQGSAPWQATAGATTGKGTDSTTGAYHSSYIRNTVLPKAYTYWLSKDFDNVYPFWEINSTAISTSATSSGVPTMTGCASSYGWYAQTDARCTLPSIENLTGSDGFTSSGYDIGALKEQLAIFKGGMGYQEFLGDIGGSWHIRNTWTKNTASSTSACYVAYDGLSHYCFASLSCGVRPLAFVG